VTTAVSTAGTACRRTAGRSGPAVALYQSPGVVFHSGDRLRFAVLRYVQVKAVGTVRKQQHIVYRVPATMRFRCDLQSCAVTVDGSRLDDDGPCGSTRPVSRWWSLVHGRQVVVWRWICCSASWCLWDRVVKCCTMPASVCDSGMRESNRTLPEYSPQSVRAVVYRRLLCLCHCSGQTLGLQWIRIVRW